MNLEEFHEAAQEIYEEHGLYDFAGPMPQEVKWELEDLWKDLREKATEPDIEEAIRVGMHNHTERELCESEKL